jgi:purine-binding chemotaxis protein CheW
MTLQSVRERPGACRACVFVVGDRVVGIDVSMVRQVLILREYTRVPGAPAHVLGVVNHRGAILPLLDPRPLLGCASRPIEPGARALVVQTGADQVGLLIDGVVGLEGFDEVLPLETPARDARLGTGVVRRSPGDPPVLLLDVPKVLNALRIGLRARPSAGLGPPTPPGRP